MIITRLSAFTRITFRILGEGQIFSDMTPSFVKIGRVAHSLLAMKKAVNAYKCVLSAMDGKNNSFIQ